MLQKVHCTQRQMRRSRHVLLKIECIENTGCLRSEMVEVAEEELAELDQMLVAEAFCSVEIESIVVSRV